MFRNQCHVRKLSSEVFLGFRRCFGAYWSIVVLYNPCSAQCHNICLFPSHLSFYILMKYVCNLSHWLLFVPTLPLTEMSWRHGLDSLPLCFMYESGPAHWGLIQLDSVTQIKAVLCYGQPLKLAQPNPLFCISTHFNCFSALVCISAKPVCP